MFYWVNVIENVMGIVVVMFLSFVIFWSVVMFLVSLKDFVLINVGDVVDMVSVLLFILFVLIVNDVGMVFLCNIKILFIFLLIIWFDFRFIIDLGKLVLNVVCVNLVMLNSIFCICLLWILMVVFIDDKLIVMLSLLLLDSVLLKLLNLCILVICVFFVDKKCSVFVLLFID